MSRPSRSNVVGWMPDASKVTAGMPVISEPTAARPPPWEWPVIARLPGGLPSPIAWANCCATCGASSSNSPLVVSIPAPCSKLVIQSSAPSAVPR